MNGRETYPIRWNSEKQLLVFCCWLLVKDNASEEIEGRKGKGVSGAIRAKTPERRQAVRRVSMQPAAVLGLVVCTSHSDGYFLVALSHLRRIAIEQNVVYQNHARATLNTNT